MGRSSRLRHRAIGLVELADERLRLVSRPQPNAMTLYIALILSGRDPTVPGLYAAGPGTLADDLGYEHG